MQSSSSLESGKNELLCSVMFGAVCGSLAVTFCASKGFVASDFGLLNDLCDLKFDIVWSLSL